MVTYKGLKGWSVKQHVIKLKYDDDNNDDAKKTPEDANGRIRRSSRRVGNKLDDSHNFNSAVKKLFRDNPANVTLMRRADSMQIMIGDCIKFEDQGNSHLAEEDSKRIGLIKRIDVDLPYRIEITVIIMYTGENVLNSIKNLNIPFQPLDKNELFLTPVQASIKLENIRSKVTVYSKEKYKEKGLVGNEAGNLFFCERACDTAYFSQPFNYDEVLEKIFDSSVKLNTYLVNLIFYENKDYIDRYGQRKGIVQIQEYEAKLKAKEKPKLKHVRQNNIVGEESSPKKKRGRPRKEDIKDELISDNNSLNLKDLKINTNESSNGSISLRNVDGILKRKRGRPRKNAANELTIKPRKDEETVNSLERTEDENREENTDSSSDDFILLSDEESSESDFLDDDDSDYEEGIKKMRRKRRVKGAISGRGRKRVILSKTTDYALSPQIPKRLIDHIGNESIDEINLEKKSHDENNFNRKQNNKISHILFQNAKERLHTSALLASLPCREEEFAQIYLALESLLLQEMGSCLYVSGTPGTGKTATVRKVISELLKRQEKNKIMNQMRQVLKNESKKYKKNEIEKIKSKLKLYTNSDDKIYQFINKFNFVEINGLKLITPNTVYEILWEKISGGERLSANNAKNSIEHYLLENEAGEFLDRKPLIVLMDEIDQIVTKNQGIMYNFFNWPTYNNSKLIVIAIANTMDLPERVLTNKISSRLGLSRILFPGYTHDQLAKIIEKRISELEDINDKNSLNNKKLRFEKSATEFASRKVASVSGDARRGLSICRRAVEIAEKYYMDLKKIEGNNEKERSEEDVVYYIKIQHIIKAIQETTHSPISLFIMNLTVMQKIFLVLQLRRQKYSGFLENELRDVIDEMKRVISMNFLDCNDKNYESPLIVLEDGWNKNIFDVFLKTRGDGANRNSSRADVTNINNCLSMQSHVLISIVNQLTEAGIIAQERKKSNQSKMVKLIVPEDEVFNALRKEKIFQKVLGT